MALIPSRTLCGVMVAIEAVSDCSSRGEADTVQTIADKINRSTSGVTVPTRGISTNEYYNRLWQILGTEYDAALITLDEVDRLSDDDILMILSRAREAGKVDVPIGIISIQIR